MNPLRCNNSSLAPNFLIVAKVAVIYILFGATPAFISRPFLPFIPILDMLPQPHLYQLMLQASLVAACALLLFNIYVRSCCLAIFLILVLQMLGNQMFFSFNAVFAAALFFMLALQPKGKRESYFYFQFGLIYFGAGLDKLLDADWRSGVYLQEFFLQFQNPNWLGLKSIMPPLVVLSWVTIVTELSLSLCFFSRRFLSAAVWFAILFHFLGTYLANRNFGYFTYVLPFSYLTVWAWPTMPLTATMSEDRVLHRILFHICQFLDFDNGIVWEKTKDKAQKLQVFDGEHLQWGFSAARPILLCLPAFFIFAEVFLLITTVSWRHAVPGATLSIWYVLPIVFFAPLARSGLR